MYISNLKLLNYRNYSSLEMSFNKRYNVIYGNNAQGKTNVLEAIFLCAFGKSHRTSRDSDLIKFDKDSFYVKAEVARENFSTEIEIVYDNDRKKKIKINKTPIKKLAELIGNMNSVIFSPEDLSIIKGGPSERRRFIDMALSQLKPSYFYDLQQYAKVIAQRNNLLKSIKDNRNLISTLDVWNINLAALGVRIVNARNKFTETVNEHAHRNHLKLSGAKEELSIIYDPSIKIGNVVSDEEQKNNFIKVLERNFKREAIQCTTLAGPQRDDYIIRINGLDIKNYGSQGQQRTALLSLKLSEIGIIRELTGENPVLLLDDVMSELDENRQKYLLETLDNIQVFITCTDKIYFENINNKDINVYKVENGNIRVNV